MNMKKDYFSLPFEIHYRSVGIELYELLSDEEQSDEVFSGNPAIEISNGIVHNVGFRCNEPSKDRLLFTMKHLEFVPEWLEKLEVDDDGLSIEEQSRRGISLDEYGAVEIDDSSDSSDFEDYQYVGQSAMYYNSETGDPYLILDADGDRVKTDMEGYPINENDERIGNEPIVSYTDEDLDAIEAYGRDRNDIYMEIGTWLGDHSASE